MKTLVSHEKVPTRCRIGACAVGLSVVVALATAGYQPSKGAVHLKNGEAAISGGEFAEAEQHFSEALILLPGSAQAYVGRGRALEAQDSLLKAATDYEHALLLDSDSPATRERLVRVLVELGDGRQALEQLAAVSGELSLDLLLLRGRAYLQTGQVREAIADFDRILNKDAEMPLARYDLGEAHAKLGQLPLAEQDFSAVLELDATDSLLARAYWGRSQVRTRLGQSDEADEDRQSAAKLDPRRTFVDSAMGRNMLETITGRSGDELRLDPLTK